MYHASPACASARGMTNLIYPVSETGAHFF